MHRATMNFKAVSVLILAFVIATLVPAPATAGAERFEFDLPIAAFEIECLGEEIEGLWHIRQVVHVRESANGGLHVTENWKINGLIVGLTSGTEWAIRGASNFKLNTQGEQVTLNRVDPIVGVARSEGPTLIGHLHWTMVVNANGVETRSFFVDTIECRGAQ